MKDLTKTASFLDKICAIVSVALSIASVCLIVGTVLLGAAFLFNIPPHIVGSGYNEAELDFLSFTVAENYAPDYKIIWTQSIVEFILTFLCLTRIHVILNSTRAILSPMKEGQPFHSTVSSNLAKIARQVIAVGIVWNLQQIISRALLIKAFDLHLLLLSEKITHVDFLFSFDLSFLLISGILLLLSYVFRYGQDLQQLSDETL